MNNQAIHYRWYLLTLALTSTVLFLALVAYFPSKPNVPPSQSASEDVLRPSFTKSVRRLVTSKNAILANVALSLSCGTFGAWAAVMTINFQPLGNKIFFLLMFLTQNFANASN